MDVVLSAGKRDEGLTVPRTPRTVVRSGERVAKGGCGPGSKACFDTRRRVREGRPAGSLTQPRMDSRGELPAGRK